MSRASRCKSKQTCDCGFFDPLSQSRCAISAHLVTLIAVRPSPYRNRRQIAPNDLRISRSAGASEASGGAVGWMRGLCGGILYWMPLLAGIPHQFKLALEKSKPFSIAMGK